MVSQEQLGRTIVKLRKLLGLSQESFALESGIDRRYVSDIENGKRNISFEVLSRIASFFNISLSSLFLFAERSGPFEDQKSLNRFLTDRGINSAGTLSNPLFVFAVIGISDEGQIVYSFSLMVAVVLLTAGLRRSEAEDFVKSSINKDLAVFKGLKPIIVYSVEK